MKKSYIMWPAMLFSLLVLQPGALFAAEGTARLTFQKTAVIKDKPQIYIIKKGDTVAGIIRKMGRSAPRLEAIRQLNPHIPNLHKIYPGQKLILTQEGEKKDGEEGGQAVRDYAVKKGDTITGIILYELNAEPPDVVNILRSVKRMNPDVDNFNKIYPGQTLKIPDGSQAAGGKEPPAFSGAAASKTDEKTPPTQTPRLTPDNITGLIGQIIRLLNGTVIASGNHYIPLPEAGQVTINCATTPVVELDDGTTVLLDVVGRLPEDLIKMVQAVWPNYRFVKMAPGEGIETFLQKIILQSKSYTMSKADKPVFIEDEPQVKLLPDWTIVKKAPSGNVLSRLGLIFADDESQLLPRSILEQARKKGINICEILGGKIRESAGEGLIYAPAMGRISGDTNEAFLYNFLVFLGFDPLRNRDVKVFDTSKDGFDLSIRADLFVKMENNKTLLIIKNKLPQQFSDILRAGGMEPLYLAQGRTRKGHMEGVLAALGISCQFAVFSVPEQGEKVRVAVSFSALKIESPQGQFYLIDFDMSREIYELLREHWKLKIIRY